MCMCVCPCPCICVCVIRACDASGVKNSRSAFAFSARVCLADQYEPAHNHGSSHGDGRIYRVAYTEDIYVDMMLHSLPLWRELQAFAGIELMAQTGGLQFIVCSLKISKLEKCKKKLIDEFAEKKKQKVL